MEREAVTQSPYAELLVELDGYVSTIRDAAFDLKGAAEGVEAIQRNADRLLASAKMLEMNIGDILGTQRTMACWTEDDSRL